MDDFCPLIGKVCYSGCILYRGDYNQRCIMARALEQLDDLSEQVVAEKKGQDTLNLFDFGAFGDKK